MFSLVFIIFTLIMTPQTNNKLYFRKFLMLLSISLQGSYFLISITIDSFCLFIVCKNIQIHWHPPRRTPHTHVY